MGTIILTLSISVRIKLYKVSTSVGEFLACISGFVFCFFFWSVLFSVDPLPPRLFLPCQTPSQSALPSEISFVQPLFILYSKLASHPFLSSTDELPHRLACCSRHICSRCLHPPFLLAWDFSITVPAPSLTSLTSPSLSLLAITVLPTYS